MEQFHWRLDVREDGRRRGGEEEERRRGGHILVLFTSARHVVL